jgi:hypothetical protein
VFAAAEATVRTYMDEITAQDYGGDLAVAWQQLSSQIQSRLTYSRFVTVFNTTQFDSLAVYASRRVDSSTVIPATSWDYYDWARDSNWRSSSGDWELRLVSGRWVITDPPC